LGGFWLFDTSDYLVSILRQTERLTFSRNRAKVKVENLFMSQKGFVQIPLLIAIIVATLIISGSFLYGSGKLPLKNIEPENKLAAISQQVNTESNRASSSSNQASSSFCYECPTCKPEIITKEVPVEKIITKTVLVPQECPSCNEDTIVSPETPKSTAIILQSLNDRQFSLKNVSSETIILHRLKFYSPLTLGEISLYIKFPDSIDSATEYKLGGLLFYNHEVEIFIDCKRNYDGILSSEDCKRKQLEVASNEIRNGETAVLRIALKEDSIFGIAIPSGKHRLEYVSGSITGASTTEDIIFSDFSF